MFVLECYILTKLNLKAFAGKSVKTSAFGVLF